MRPKCIILDEATSMLDPIGRKNVMETVLRLNREEKITIILITHYMEEAAQADYIYVMNQGKAVMHGTPAKVFCQSEKLTEYRIVAPQITQIIKKLKEAGIPLSEDILSEKELAERLLQIAGGN
jgi:ABC-type multidrug transport system ATPase subunit